MKESKLMKRNHVRCISVCIIIAVLLGSVGCYRDVSAAANQTVQEQGSQNASDNGKNEQGNIPDDWNRQIRLAHSPADYGYGSGWSYHIKENESETIFISGDGIMRRNKETGESKIIVSNTDEYRIDTMEITSDRIYYGAYFHDAHTSKVFSSDLNGRDITLLFDGTLYEDFEWKELNPPSWGLKFIEGLHISGNILYINSTTSSFAYDIKTKDIKGFVQDINSSAFFENKFYYLDHGLKTFSIFEKDLATGNTKLIRGDGLSKRGSGIDVSNEEMFDGVYAAGGKLYYTKRLPAQLYQYSPDGEDVLIATFPDEAGHGSLVISAGYQKLYFNFDNDIYECDADSNKYKKIITVQDIKKYRYDGFLIVDDLLTYCGDDGTVKHMRCREDESA